MDTEWTMYRLAMSSELVPFKNSQGRFVGVQCSAMSKQTGNRCRRFTGHPGLGVCKFHGGAVRRVRDAADRRIQALVPTAIMTIQDLMENPTSSERFRAARLVLRYSGINASNLWKDADSGQLAIEGGTPAVSAEDQIEELLRGLRDTPPDETSG